MIDLVNHSLAEIFFASLALVFVAVEIGHRLGLSVDECVKSGTLEAAAFGLLALMISFTFSMALVRFEARRAALLDEATAIGTTALRARLLPAPEGEESLKLLKDYIQIRLDYVRNYTGAEDTATISRSNRIQEALWQRAESAYAKNNAMVPTGLYFQILNETIDDQERRLTVMRNHVPTIVFVALYGMAAVALGFSGYTNGIERWHWRLPVYVMGIVVAAVILLIFDLDRPTGGFIFVSQQPMIDTAEAVDGYLAELQARTPQRRR